jgi:xanthine dehydrogenase iron-sulfur cluster and FAD-binding subunit A
MWSKYVAVSRIEEALQLLDAYRERARVIAGGTDILIELEQGKRPDVDVLIDLTRVPGLDAITLHEGVVTLGPLVNHNHVVASDIISKCALPIAQASWEVGAPQIRNRATVAGNLITASPANDTIVPLMALDASVTLTSVDGERRVALKDFYTGLRKTVMQPNELLTAVTFAALGDMQRAIFLKLGLRRAQAISVVNCAAVLGFDADSTVTQAAIALGSVAPTIIRVPQAETALVGAELTPENIANAARIAGSVPKPIDDVRSTAEYRSEMVKVLVARALRALATNTQAATFPRDPAMLWGAGQARVNGNQLSTQATHEAGTPIECTVNGKPVSVRSGQDKTLLHWLREDVGLTGTKEGCSEGECGACTVFLDGAAVMACMVAAPRAHGADITTVEGLKQGDSLHPIQTAFIDEAAVQCGYCTPGFLMAGAKLLEERPQPSKAQIQQSISGNLCRCTGYYKIVDAFVKASQQANTSADADG